MFQRFLIASCILDQAIFSGIVRLFNVFDDFIDFSTAILSSKTILVDFDCSHLLI